MKKFLLLSLALIISANPINALSQDSDDSKGDKSTEEKVIKNDPVETLKLLDQFGDVFEKIRRDYVEQVADKEILESAINGMLTSLDPHSSFLNEDDFKDMQEQTKGEFGGLGIEVTMKNGLVYIVAPIDDTPAYKAGLKAGDYISQIDKSAVYGMSISEAVKKMRGKPGTKIKLKIIREGEKKPLKITITRDIIKVNSVKSKKYDDVAYIRISSFTNATGQNVVNELSKLTKEIGKDKLQGIVLDLRNNPGGLLNEAINVSDAFLDKGEIVSTKGRHSEDSQKFSATAGDVSNGAPIVVLINGGSASASEIVSGALQDHKRAVVIGEKSFGKGSVQTVIPITSKSAIRLTTSRYYTPSGVSIQAKGITPDITVKQAKIELNDDVERTKEADLRGHLSNGNDEEDDNEEEGEEASKTKVEIDVDVKVKENDDELQKKLFTKEKKKTLQEEDYQLSRALDMVKALYVYSKK